MNTTRLFPNTLFTLFLSLGLLTAGCKNPASSDNDHEHTEPMGLQLVMNGETLVEYSDGQTDGQIDLDEGDVTALITVEFLNEEHKPIHDEDLGDEYSLGWDIENEDILGVESNDGDGRWSFHLIGKSAGTSRIQFQLLHGEHSDFETPAVDKEEAIEVNVAAP